MITRLLVLLTLSLPAFAGTSNVTATITDPDSQTWNNCTYTVDLQSPNGPPTVSGVAVTPTHKSGSCSSSGVITVTLTDTSTIDQSGATWKWTLQPNASVLPTVISTTVTGGSPNLSTQLSAVAAPRFQATATSFGYLNAEVVSPALGATYFNVTDGCTVSFGLTGWSSCSSGSTFNALTGDATSTATGGVTTVVGINGTLLSSLATGPLCNTTSTGVPSICGSTQGTLFSVSTAANTVTTAGSPIFFPVNGTFGGTSGEGNVVSVIGGAGCTARNAYVITNSTNGTGALTITLRNGTTFAGMANTAIVVTIGSGASAGPASDTTHTVALTAGSLVSWSVSMGGTTQTSAQVMGIGFQCN